MDLEQKSLRVGAAVIICAVLLKLAGSGVLQPVIDLMRRPDFASFMMYMETGRVARFYAPEEIQPDWIQESPVPNFTESDTKELETPVIRAEDAELVALRSTTSYDPDLEELLLQPLEWDLTGDEPKVLILHTHATESYTKTPEEDYEESADYRTLDEGHNLVSVGDALAERLEAGGVSVIHDRSFHDYPSYNGSYGDARESMAAYLEEYPSIEMVLDLHRDAADTPQGQLQTFATVDDTDSCQLMMVVGTDDGGLEHPNWRENLALALKLHVVLEKENPGLCRDISFRCSRFNQDLSTGALLIEVGAAGDTRQRALAAVEALADGIISMAHGVIIEN